MLLSLLFLTDVYVSHVDVLFVDYGNREKVKVSNLRALPQEFMRLPSQAICCALAEVRLHCILGLVHTLCFIVIFCKEILKMYQLSEWKMSTHIFTKMAG